VDSFFDDINVVIRKQLSSDSVKYKRIGIVGGSSILRRPVDVTQPSSLEYLHKQGVDVLKLMITHSQSNQDCRALLFDELASLIEDGNMDAELGRQIGEMNSTTFDDSFVGDLETFADLPATNPPNEVTLTDNDNNVKIVFFFSRLFLFISDVCGREETSTSQFTHS